jgi:hypothetical protein
MKKGWEFARFSFDSIRHHRRTKSGRRGGLIAPAILLPRVRSEPPRCRAAEQRDDLAPPNHSITIVGEQVCNN